MGLMEFLGLQKSDKVPDKDIKKVEDLDEENGSTTNDTTNDNNNNSNDNNLGTFESYINSLNNGDILNENHNNNQVGFSSKNFVDEVLAPIIDGNVVYAENYSEIIIDTRHQKLVQISDDSDGDTLPNGKPKKDRPWRKKKVTPGGETRQSETKTDKKADTNNYNNNTRQDTKSETQTDNNIKNNKVQKKSIIEVIKEFIVIIEGYRDKLLEIFADINYYKKLNQKNPNEVSSIFNKFHYNKFNINMSVKKCEIKVEYKKYYIVSLEIFDQVDQLEEYIKNMLNEPEDTKNNKNKKIVQVQNERNEQRTKDIMQLFDEIAHNLDKIKVIGETNKPISGGPNVNNNITTDDGKDITKLTEGKTINNSIVQKTGANETKIVEDQINDNKPQIKDTISIDGKINETENQKEITSGEVNESNTNDNNHTPETHHYEGNINGEELIDDNKQIKEDLNVQDMTNTTKDPTKPTKHQKYTVEDLNNVGKSRTNPKDTIETDRNKDGKGISGNVDGINPTNGGTRWK